MLRWISKPTFSCIGLLTITIATRLVAEGMTLAAIAALVLGSIFSGVMEYYHA